MAAEWIVNKIRRYVEELRDDGAAVSPTRTQRQWWDV